MNPSEIIRRFPALPNHLLIGLSGGADSVALAQLLLYLREEQGIQLSVVHVNHGLRGEASDRDEAFVRDFCQMHALPLYAYHAVLPLDASEEEARHARYAFFKHAVQKTGADALVLAHHRDDQAETMLMHLMRGSGLTGLSGMATDSTLDGMRILRPLLTTSRAELRALLTALNQPWREDASNAETHYLRNAIRHKLLPMMEQLSPGCTARMAASAEGLHGEDNLLQQQANAFLKENAGTDWIALRPLRTLEPPMQARILRSWWQNSHPEAAERSLSREQTAQLVALLQGKIGAACPLPMRETARISWHCLHLELGQAAINTQILPATDGTVFSGYVFRVLKESETPTVLPESWLADCVIRTMQEGDWIRPFSMEGKQTLKDYFAKRHIDAPFRSQIPLLCRGSEVLHVCSVGAGHLPDKNTTAETKVSIRWEGIFPWTM